MSQDKKQRLKSAAYVIFSRKGYKATGISEIAKQAGMAVGSFYNYYDSKEAIFLDVYIDENNRVRQAMRDDIDWQGDAVELVGQIFSQSRNLVSSSKILAEWYNPAISDELHSYYSSEKGKDANPFHQFLVETFTNRMLAEGYSQEKSKKCCRFISFSTIWIPISLKRISLISVKPLKPWRLTLSKDFLIKDCDSLFFKQK